MSAELKVICEEILRLDAEATAGPWAEYSWDPRRDAPYTKADAALMVFYRTLAPQLARAVLETLETKQ